MHRRLPSLNFNIRTHLHNPSTDSNSSSVVSPATPTTPQTSGSSMSSPKSRAPPFALSKSAAAAAAAQTRAELRAIVRTDWTFPALSSPSQLRLEPDTPYTEQEFWLSSGSSSPPLLSPKLPTLSSQATNVVDGGYDPYRFQDPDAVGDALNKRLALIRKQHRDEMLSNEGLRVFEARRNAWTGTVQATVPPGGVLLHRDLVSAGKEREGSRQTRITRQDEVDPTLSEDRSVEEQIVDRGRRKDGINGVSQSSAMLDKNVLGSKHIAISGSGEDEADSFTTAADAINDGHGAPAAPNAHLDHPFTPPRDSSSFEDDFDSSAPLPTLTPHPPPLVPNSHPIRSQISPRAYASIYTKVVVQSTTPGIPINLRDVVASCVEGWKRDGEWPPKPNAHPEAPIAAVKHGSRKGPLSPRTALPAPKRISGARGIGATGSGGGMYPAGAEEPSGGLRAVGRGVRKVVKALGVEWGDGSGDEEDRDVPGLVPGQSEIEKADKKFGREFLA